MDLLAVRRFVAAAELGCFRKAAERLSVTQPAITRSVRLLEAELGIRLFDRHSRGVVVTGPGAQFLPHARLLVHDADRALSQLNPSAVQATGKVVLGVTPFQSEAAIAGALAEFMRRVPAVQCELRIGDTQSLMQWLLDGDLDVAMATYDGEHDSAELERIPVRPLRTTMIVRAAHPLLGRHDLNLVDLVDVGWAVTDASGVRRDFGRMFERAGLRIPAPRLWSQSMPLLKRLVAATDLVTILDLDAVEAEVRAGILAELPMQNPPLEVPVYLVLRRRAVRSPTLAALTASLQDVGRAGNPAGLPAPARPLPFAARSRR